MAGLEKITHNKKRRVGFIGCPPEEAIEPFRGREDIELVDLDNEYPGMSASRADRFVPANTCSIIKRILDNTLALEPELVVYDDGYSKCDNARFLGEVIEHVLPGVKLERTQNDNMVSRGTPVSDSTLTLREKVDMILDDFIDTRDRTGFAPCAAPPAAFWGVPGADPSIYDLFPPGTLVLGWLRCFENRTPADLELETFVPPGVPTIFFAQTFCSKNILAKHLARRYNGLYVDSDGTLTRSERAKIEAFLHFRREGH